MQLQPVDYEQLNSFETSGERYQRVQWYRRGRAVGFLYGALFAGIAWGVVWNWLL